MDRLPNGKVAHFGVQVEHDTGKQVYKGSLDVKGEDEADLDRQATPVGAKH